MKKATQKSTPVSLGTKRTCPGCGTKFYDFAKDEIVCPKCETKLDEEQLNPVARNAPEAKKPSKGDREIEAATVQSEDIVIDDNEEMLESVDELDDDEEDLVEDLEVDDEEEQEF